MMFRTYVTDSGLIVVTAATGVIGPLLYIAPPATATGNVFKFKCSSEAGAAAPVVPANSDVQFVLAKVTGTKAGGAAVTPTPTSPDQLAANIVFSSGTTAITGLTQGATLWPGTTGLTPGSSINDDDPNTGTEVWLAASGQYAVYGIIPAGPGNFTGALRAVVSHAE